MVLGVLCLPEQAGGLLPMSLCTAHHEHDAYEALLSSLTTSSTAAFSLEDGCLLHTDRVSDFNVHNVHQQLFTVHQV